MIFTRCKNAPYINAGFYKEETVKTWNKIAYDHYMKWCNKPVSFGQGIENNNCTLDVLPDQKAVYQL